MKILWFSRFQIDVDFLRVDSRLHMCQKLKELGNNILLAVAGDRQQIDQCINAQYVTVFTIKLKFLRILSFIICGYVKFLLCYFKFKPDVVLFDIYSIWFSIPFAFFPKNKTKFLLDNRSPFYNLLPNTVTMEDRIMKTYTSLCYKYSKVFIDGVTTITEHYKKHLCKDFEFNNKIVGVWGSGVDIEQFSPDRYKDYTKPAFLKDKFVLMQHGDISYNRGLIETIEAISIVNKDDICFLLIGNSVVNCRAKNDLLELCKKLTLTKNVYILPPVKHSEIAKYISYCDCPIMAYPNIEYWNNNNPLKLLEYLAMAKSGIYTDMPSFKDVMGNKKCAIYIKNNSPETIAEAIKYCYKNREHLVEWGKDGRDIVKDNFTWGRQAKKLLNFMKEIS